jgi:endonuclease/exonuclease/phosphatase family metal-dependent hydrolase
MIQANQELVTVMSWNVYFGMDVGPILSVTDPAGLIAAFATAWEQVQATNIFERAEIIAGEIARTKPDLIGLQEVAQFFVTVARETVIKYDFLESIILALSTRGLFYVPLMVRNDLDQTVPIDMAGTLVRILDRHVVLLRIKEPTTGMRPYSVRSETFSTLFQIPNAIVGPITVPRSWISIDVMIHSSRFRLIETHLESLSTTVQAAQAQELLAGPANAELPVVMLGDFNSDPEPNAPNATPTYSAIIAAGYEDVWTTVNANAHGNTCCHQPDLRNVVSELGRRIDLILVHGLTKAIDAKLVGDQPTDRTSSGLWPSDHAGVVATLQL